MSNAILIDSVSEVSNEMWKMRGTKVSQILVDVMV